MDRTESRPEIKQEELLGDVKHTIGAGPSPGKEPIVNISTATS